MSVYFVRFTVKHRVIPNFSYIVWELPVLGVLQKLLLPVVSKEVVDLIVLLIACASLVMFVLGFFGVFIFFKKK